MRASKIEISKVTARNRKLQKPMAAASHLLSTVAGLPRQKVSGAKIDAAMAVKCMPQIAMPITSALPVFFQNAVRMVSDLSWNEIHIAAIEAATAMATEAANSLGS